MAAFLLASCSGPSLKDEVVRYEPSFASPPAQEGLLWDLADGVMREHGAEASGFRLLDGSYDSLAARLALIDSAVSSLDIQTYLWYPDYSGKLLLERAVQAADRGVRVRLIVDDLLTIGQDQLIFELHRLPNVEMRLFNPWRDRSTLARGAEFIAEMERMNTRMHDKLLIADGNAAVVGGRNIGDHYFGLSHDYNFHDLDLLGFGHVARQANDMFDHFWNSDWVVSADNLDVEPDPDFAEGRRAALREQVRSAEELQAFGAESRDWRSVAAELAKDLHIGTSRIVYDETADQAISQNLAAGMFNFMGRAQRELLVTNARIESVAADSGEVSVIEIPRFEASGLNLAGNPIPLSLELRIPTGQAMTIRVNGAIKVDQGSQQVTFDSLDIRATGATRKPLKLVTAGQVDISRQVADLNLELELGAARGTGKLRFASYESPQIDTELQLNRASPALFALAGPEAAGEAGEQGAPTEGDSPLPLDALRLVDTRARLEIKQVELEPHVLNEVKVSLRALEGVITVDTFTGTLHGGRLDLTATFDGKHNTARLESAGKLESLDIATALDAMNSRPVFSGSASLDWNLTGSGRTANELIQGLTGPLNLTTAAPVLRGTSVEGMLCEAVALVNQERLTATFPTDTSFQELGAALALADGRLNLAPLTATLPGVQLTGRGDLDLLSRDFKTTFKARLSPQLEELDRACRVSKRLTAIDWPVKCRGNIEDEPANWCRVDTDAIIEDLATNEAKRQIEKEAGKLLDKLFK